MPLPQDELERLSREACSALRPLLRGVDGGGVEHVATLSLLALDDQVLVLTAEHALVGSNPLRIGVPNRDPVKLSGPFGLLRARDSASRDPDIAFVTGESPPLGIDVPHPPFAYYRELCLPEPYAPAQFIAAGAPVSRSKVRIAHDNLSAEFFWGAFEAKDPEWYTKYGVNAETHIAVTYSRNDVQEFSGAPAVGPEPRGMSGGALLVVAQIGERLRMVPVAILIEYRQAWDEALIGVRLHTIVDSILGERDGMRGPWGKVFVDVVEELDAT